MGESRRIEQLYVRHASAVTAYALRRTDRATAEEVVGEVFLLAWRRRDVVGDESLRGCWESHVGCWPMHVGMS